MKKIVSEDLKSKNIVFNIENIRYQALRFDSAKMIVDLIVLDGDDKTGIQKFPFAHIPKSIKKIIKPN